MENAPVISLNGISAYPDVNPEIWQRCLKWMEEVNVPVMFANSPRKGIDRYFTARENPMYPMLLSLHHHENLASLQNTQRTIDQTNRYGRRCTNWPAVSAVLPRAPSINRIPGFKMRPLCTWKLTG
jgi:hypothetical protein